MSTSSPSHDDGAAIVEFTMVAAFVVIPLFLGIVQLALVLHARNIVVASASIGARHRASADGQPGDGRIQAERRIRASLPAVEDALQCTEGTAVGGAAGNEVALIEVRCAGPIPMFFLPFGSVHLSVAGHAVDESSLAP